MQRPFSEKRKLFNSPTKGQASTSRNNKRDFVTPQRRYDNVRVRDSEMRSRLCCECGQQIVGEKKYQEHIISHECTYLVYNLYYSEQENSKKKNLNFSEETTSHKHSENKNKGSNLNKRKLSEERTSGGGGLKLSKGMKYSGK